ncbi:uncharacterized protein EI90DRAFT_2975148 [Cantharellus anzutake]|uniref:uncharacterized protein n=1 Tax=Cantharellus anzutake TaxID=1750568 RepID=UPI001904DBB9|nr:uncharacterized protein EI90DRAFT_2975148 [Cantharellus anzutake]KAF8327164.1 hypothetical protein EI90DRAFT_2975148 [Cantharellus anzutake]
MASSDDDHFDLGDELLALAGDSESNKPRKKRAAPTSKGASSSKRRKQEVPVQSDEDEPESEEDESNPYPLDGIYKDELDRQRLMQMNEIEREQILAERREQHQKLLDKMNLERLLKAKRRDQNSPDDDKVSSAAKRKHTATGRTQEKARGLAALTEKRRAKKELFSSFSRPISQRRTRPQGEKDEDSPKRTKRESSSEEYSDEDGEANKEEPREEKERPEVVEEIGVDDLSKARITRDMLAKYCFRPWFEELVKGAWIRYNFGPDQSGRPTYRICEVVDVGVHLIPPYNLDDKTRINKQLELKHGSLQKCWNMDRVSNGPFPQDEFDSLMRHLKRDDVNPPRKSALEKKHQQILMYSKQTMTESDLQAMLRAKNEVLDNRPSFQTLLARKATLNQQLTLAQNRRDQKEIGRIEGELAELSSDATKRGEMADRTTIVNERDRKANLESIRNQEEAERERRRKAALGASMVASQNGSRSGSPFIKADLSARVKTMPKLVHEMKSRANMVLVTVLMPVSSRAGTPNVDGPTKDAKTTPFSSSIADTPALSSNSFDALTSSIELDLGDF